jgi:hypothetical protein
MLTLVEINGRKIDAIACVKKDIARSEHEEGANLELAIGTVNEKEFLGKPAGTMKLVKVSPEPEEGWVGLSFDYLDVRTGEKQHGWNSLQFIDGGYPRQVCVSDTETETDEPTYQPCDWDKVVMFAKEIPQARNEE